jgi:hypothetical protein
MLSQRVFCGLKANARHEKFALIRFMFGGGCPSISVLINEVDNVCGSIQRKILPNMIHNQLGDLLLK